MTMKALAGKALSVEKLRLHGLSNPFLRFLVGLPRASQTFDLFFGHSTSASQLPGFGLFGSLWFLAERKNQVGDGSAVLSLAVADGQVRMCIDLF